jgi:hypothetical protein
MDENITLVIANQMLLYQLSAGRNINRQTGIIGPLHPACNAMKC